MNIGKIDPINYILSDEELIKRLEKYNEENKMINIFYMRWKEEFLLPDSRIKQITGLHLKVSIILF